MNVTLRLWSDEGRRGTVLCVLAFADDRCGCSELHALPRTPVLLLTCATLHALLRVPALSLGCAEDSDGWCAVALRAPMSTSALARGGAPRAAAGVAAPAESLWLCEGGSRGERSSGCPGSRPSSLSPTGPGCARLCMLPRALSSPSEPDTCASLWWLVGCISAVVGAALKPGAGGDAE